MTPYSTGLNITPHRVSRTDLDGSTPVASYSGNSALASCPSPIPIYVCIWNGIIGNIGQTNTPNFRETSENHVSIHRIFSNYSNVPSIGSQILYDKFLISSSRDIYAHCGVGVALETVQPMVPQLVRHNIPTIDILNEKSGLWSPDTVSIRGTPNTTRGSSYEHAVVQVTAVGYAVG